MSKWTRSAFSPVEVARAESEPMSITSPVTGGAIATWDAASHTVADSTGRTATAYTITEAQYVCFTEWSYADH
jgi:hypothetical protein